MSLRRGILGLLGLLSPSKFNNTGYPVPDTYNQAGVPFDGFVSISISFEFFPVFAGNESEPNSYSYNLLSNLRSLSTTFPYIRVGGNSQDFAFYDPSQQVAVATAGPVITTGKAYFESFNTWPGVKFSYGFNMAVGTNISEKWQTLLDTAPFACQALGTEKLYAYEYGNEPNLFPSPLEGPSGELQWNSKDYVEQWLRGTRTIRDLMHNACPDMDTGNLPKFMAPSLTTGGGNLAPISDKITLAGVWQYGLNTDDDVEFVSLHNYMNSVKYSNEITLQGTLMNHNWTMASIRTVLDTYITGVADVQHSPPPLILGEANSIYGGGRPGASNVFGAALWLVDYSMYAASVGIKRIHFNQGIGSSYSLWQPIGSKSATIGTKPPYYGSIAATAMVSPVYGQPVSISTIPLLSSDAAEAAYAAHYRIGSCDSLGRIIVLNMHAYNYTVNGIGLVPLLQPTPRPSHNYTFAVPSVFNGRVVTLHRLMANGSDALSGITYDGWSYNYELNNGQPVRLPNVTIGETTTVVNGQVSVSVPDSSALLLSFV